MMQNSQTPEFKKKMSAAKKILGASFKEFEELIKKYQARLYSPEWDVICFSMVNKLTKKKKKLDRWLSFWSRNRQPINFRNLTYLVPFAYANFISTDESTGYLFQILDYFKEREQPFSWDVFLQIFFDYRAKIMPTFYRVEFEVFSTILEEQTLKNKFLAKKLSIDPSNLSKYKKKLKDKNLIFEGLSLNYALLNLAVYGLVFNVPLKTKIDFFKELPESSFMHSIYTSYSNAQTVMVHYITPDNKLVKKDLKKVSKQISTNHKVISANIYRFDVSSRLKSFTYSNYKYKKGKWDLPYYKIVANLTNEKREETKDIPFIRADFTQFDKTKLNLNKVGIEILNNMLLQNTMSAKEIRKELSISEKEARRHIKNFERLEYFRTRINPNYVFGLSNLVLFLEKEPKNQVKIHKQLAIFPEVYSQTYLNEKNKGLHFIIRVPNEMIFDTMGLINSAYKEAVKELFVINQMYSKRWLLPTERYDTLFQEWKYSPKDILG